MHWNYLSFVLVGSLASSPDPDIILDVLNFVLSSEVSEFYVILEVIIFSYNLINYGLMELGMLMVILFPINLGSYPRCCFWTCC